jgi:S1-C subfamily serine protease
MTPGGPVLVKKRFLGSGFIIHRKLQANSFLVITCCHVIDDLKPNEGEHLMVRLPGTTEDIDANPHESDDEFDLQVVSVRVPPQRQIRVDQFPCVQFSAPAPPVPVGALVATMGYYNPINLPLYLQIDGPLFSTEPSAYGGYVV